MTLSPARRLVVVFGALTALFEVVVALPGGPSYAPGASVAFWIAVEAVLVWRLWHGSVFAWFLLLVGAIVTLPLFFLLGPPSDAGSIASAVLSFGMLVILLAPPLLRFVWSRGKPAVAA